MERLGRKQMMQVSYGAMGASLVVIAVCTAAGRSSGSATLVIVASIVAYVLSFAFGAGAIPGVYVNEIAPSAGERDPNPPPTTTTTALTLPIHHSFDKALTDTPHSGVHSGALVHSFLGNLANR